MSRLADRLRARGITDPGGFRLWAHGAGHPGPLNGILDRDLDALVAQYRQEIALPAAGRGPTGMDPAEARRIFQEGADRGLVRKVVDEVIRHRLAGDQPARPYRPSNQCDRCRDRFWECRCDGGSQR